MRSRVLQIAAATVALLAMAVVLTARAGAGPDESEPVMVGSAGLDAESIRSAATAGGLGLATAADRATETAWLRGEAQARGLRAALDLPGLRRQVASAVAARASGPRVFATAFETLHDRWRSRTRCLPAYADPVMDRCANLPASAAGTCRWMGQVWVCRAGRRWLVVGGPGMAGGAGRKATARAAAALRRAAPAIARRVRTDASAGTFTLRLRSRRAAAGVAFAAHRSAVRARESAARSARAARARAARERSRRAREREPGLSGATVRAMAPACRRYAKAIDLYRFGLGLQDPGGAADAILAARGRGTRALRRAAADSLDRRKLAPLLSRMNRTDRLLTRMQVAAAYADPVAVESALRRLRVASRREAAVAGRLLLGDCLAVPVPR